MVLGMEFSVVKEAITLQTRRSLVWATIESGQLRYAVASSRVSDPQHFEIAYESFRIIDWLTSYLRLGKDEDA
jgi:hypothetical protein